MEWKEYCKLKWISFEKVKWSEAMQNYYFNINWFITIIQTNYPCYAFKNNDTEVINKLQKYKLIITK